MIILKEMRTWFWHRTVKETDRLKDLGANGRIILSVMVYSGYLRSTKGPCEHGNEHSRYTKRREFPELIWNYQLFKADCYK